jgi:SAM-dependent methyltransferase
LRAHGLDANTVAIETVLPLFEADPLISLWGRTYMDGQYYKFRTLNDEFTTHADLYLSELEAADKAGPGSLELNPGLAVPDYSRHEIHTQLGGYCGNPFAGYIYHYGTQIEYTGHNNQDQVHAALAARVPVPADGRVKRILDYGTGAGQLATMLKQRFPEAEVWGTDIGGPMVRYAHMRASDIGSNVNFAQRLAEDSGFPANHFDMIVSYIVHHETPAESSRKIFAEVQRTLRPGGVYFPVDIYTAAPPPTDVVRRFRSWWNWRWNHEDWQMEWMHLDGRAAMREAGLSVADARTGLGLDQVNVVGIKT